MGICRVGSGCLLLLVAVCLISSVCGGVRRTATKLEEVEEFYLDVNFQDLEPLLTAIKKTNVQDAVLTWRQTSKQTFCDHLKQRIRNARVVCSNSNQDATVMLEDDSMVLSSVTKGSIQVQIFDKSTGANKLPYAWLEFTNQGVKIFEPMDLNFKLTGAMKDKIVKMAQNVETKNEFDLSVQLDPTDSKLVNVYAVKLTGDNAGARQVRRRRQAINNNFNSLNIGSSQGNVDGNSGVLDLNADVASTTSSLNLNDMLSFGEAKTTELTEINNNMSSNEALAGLNANFGQVTNQVTDSPGMLSQQVSPLGTLLGVTELPVPESTRATLSAQAALDALGSSAGVGARLDNSAQSSTNINNLPTAAPGKAAWSSTASPNFIDAVINKQLGITNAPQETGGDAGDATIGRTDNSDEVKDVLNGLKVTNNQGSRQVKTTPTPPGGSTASTCPYQSSATHLRFSTLLYTFDRRTIAQLQQLEDSAVVTKVSAAIDQVFSAAGVKLRKLQSSKVNRLMASRSLAIVFVALEKQLDVAAAAKIPANFTGAPAILSEVNKDWSIDLRKSSVNLAKVAAPVHSICQFYDAIKSCPYIRDNKERIHLRAILHLSPYFSQDLVRNPAKLNQSVELLVHHLLESSRGFHTKHSVNNSFALKLLGQKILISAELDLWFSSRTARRLNSDELTLEFLHNLEHYLDTHSPGDTFFITLTSVKITLIPVIVPCMSYLKELPYRDRKFFAYSTSLRVTNAQDHLREKDNYFVSMCENSLMHRLGNFQLDGKKGVVDVESNNMVYISNVQFVGQTKQASIDLKVIFKINSGKDKLEIKKAFSNFLVTDDGFRRWLGIVDSTAFVDVNEKQIYRTVRHKYGDYFPQTERLIVSKLRFANYQKRLCYPYLLRHTFMRAYHYTSRGYYKLIVNRDYDFYLDHFDEELCKGESEMELSAVYTLSTSGDSDRLWKKEIIEAELLEGLKFIFPELEVTVIQMSVNSASMKFDKFRRRVQHTFTLSGKSREERRPAAWFVNFARTGVRFWLGVGQLMANVNERMYSIDGGVQVEDKDVVYSTDSTKVTVKATYTLKSSREVQWSDEALKKLFTDGYTSLGYSLDSTVLRISRLPERAVFVSTAVEKCPHMSANSTIVHHHGEVQLSGENSRHWLSLSAEKMRQAVADLIAKAYQYGPDAKLRASGFTNVPEDSVDGAEVLMVDAEVVDSKLLFRTQYMVEMLDAGFDLKPQKILEEFRLGLLRGNDPLKVQSAAALCDDCELELICKPTIGQLLEKSFSVRRVLQFIRAAVSDEFRRNAGSAQVVDHFLSNWLKMLYLEYFNDPLRKDVPPVFTYVPFDAKIPVSIESERNLVTAKYIVMRDSNGDVDRLKHHKLWNEETFGKSFEAAFKRFNEEVKVFDTKIPIEADTEFNSLYSSDEPVMVVSPYEKRVVLTFNDLDPSNCTSEIFRRRFVSLATTKYQLSSIADVKAESDERKCTVSLELHLTYHPDLDTFTWGTNQLEKYFLTVLKPGLTKFHIAVINKLVPCKYCKNKRRIFVNIDAELFKVNEKSAVEFLTVDNYKDKREHMINDHLVPAFNPSRSTVHFIGRRSYKLEDIDNAIFDFVHVGARERFSVVFDASITPPDASWSEYHLRKLLTGWMSTQNSRGRDIMLNNITVQILDPVEMSEFIPPPKSDVYEPKVNLKIPVLTSSWIRDGDLNRMISSSINSNSKTFALDLDSADAWEVRWTPDDQSRTIVIKNCTVDMLIQIPQLLTRTGFVRALRDGYNQLKPSQIKNSVLIDFFRTEVTVTYDSKALPQRDCSQESRRVKFLIMLKLLNTRDNRKIANITTAKPFYDPVGIKEFIDDNVLDYYGNDITINEDDPVTINYRSTKDFGVIQADYSLTSEIAQFQWISFVTSANSVLNDIKLKTSYDGHKYHDVTRQLGYLQFRGVPITRIYDRCSFSTNFRVLQFSKLEVIDPALFSRLRYDADPDLAIKRIVETIFSMKQSGYQIFRLSNEGIPIKLHQKSLSRRTTLRFSISYKLVAINQYNIGESILGTFVQQNMQRIARVFGLLVKEIDIELLEYKQNGLSCISRVVTNPSQEKVKTEKVGCFPALDSSLTAGVCAKSNTNHLQVPIEHKFVMLVTKNFVFNDIFPQNDPEARSVIEFMLALTFDPKLHERIPVTWDPTYSGKTEMEVKQVKEGLRLTIEAHYILLKANKSHNVTVQNVVDIFNANIDQISKFFGGAKILDSNIRLWTPSCKKGDGGFGELTTTASPRFDYGKTGQVSADVEVKMYPNIQLSKYRTTLMRKIIIRGFVLSLFKRAGDYQAELDVNNIRETTQSNGSRVSFTIRVDMNLGSTGTTSSAIAYALLAAAKRAGKIGSFEAREIRGLQIAVKFNSAQHRSRRSVTQQGGCTSGKSQITKVHVSFTLAPAYQVWASNDPKKVMPQIIENSLSKALKTAAKQVNSVQLRYVSFTGCGVSALGEAELPCLGSRSAAHLRQEFASAWNSATIISGTQQHLTGVELRLLPAQPITNATVRLYKSMLLRDLTWLNSYLDRNSIKRKRLREKLHNILKLVYKETRATLQGFEFDVKQSAAEDGVIVFLFEDLHVASETELQQAQKYLQQINEHGLQKINKERPSFIVPCTLSDVFIKVLHITATHGEFLKLHTRKTLLVTCRLKEVPQSLFDLASSTEAMLLQVKGLHDKQVSVRALRSNWQEKQQPIRLLVDLVSSRNQEQKCKDLVANKMEDVATDIKVEFLFSNLSLHLSSGGNSDSRSTSGRKFQITQHLTGKGAASTTTNKIRMQEFWSNLVLHIVYSDLETSSVQVPPISVVNKQTGGNYRLIDITYDIVMKPGKWTEQQVQEFIKDRFDLWNLQFPYSQLQVTLLTARSATNSNLMSTTAAAEATTPVAPFTTAATFNTITTGVTERDSTTPEQIVTGLTTKATDTADVTTATSPAQSQGVEVQQLCILQLSESVLSNKESRTTVFFRDVMKHYITEPLEKALTQLSSKLEIIKSLKMTAIFDSPYLQCTVNYKLNNSSPIKLDEVQSAFKRVWKPDYSVDKLIFTQFTFADSSKPMLSLLGHLTIEVGASSADSNTALEKYSKAVQPKSKSLTGSDTIMQVTFSLEKNAPANSVTAKVLVPLEVKVEEFDLLDSLVDYIVEVFQPNGWKIKALEVPMHIIHSYRHIATEKNVQPAVLVINLSKSVVSTKIKPIMYPYIEHTIARKLNEAYNSFGIRVVDLKIVNKRKTSSSEYQVDAVAQLAAEEVKTLNRASSQNLTDRVKSGIRIVSISQPIDWLKSLKSSGPQYAIGVEQHFKIKGSVDNITKEIALSNVPLQDMNHFICSSINFIYAWLIPSSVVNCASTYDKASSIAKASYQLVLKGTDKRQVKQTEIKEIFQRGLRIHNEVFSAGAVIELLYLKLSSARTASSSSKHNSPAAHSAAKPSSSVVTSSSAGVPTVAVLSAAAIAVALIAVIMAVTAHLLRKRRQQCDSLQTTLLTQPCLESYLTSDVTASGKNGHKKRPKDCYNSTCVA